MGIHILGYFFANFVFFGISLPTLGQQVAVRFAKSDFGFVNETAASFVTLTIEKIGTSNSHLTVLIEVTFFLCHHKEKQLILYRVSIENLMTSSLHITFALTYSEKQVM